MSALVVFFSLLLFHPFFAWALVYLWWTWKLKKSPYFWSWMLGFTGGVLGLLF